MLNNFPAVLAVSLKYEGGYVDHPKDPGGATNLGVTRRTLAEWRGRNVTRDEVRALTQADVEPIYRKGYWMPIMGDQLPTGVDLAVFDFGINSGPSRAVKHLQAVVGETQDGRMGFMTLRAVDRNMPAKTVVQRLCARRLSFVRGLRTFSTFGKGWTRRIYDVEARAVAMTVGAENMQKEANIVASGGNRDRAAAGVSIGSGVAVPAWADISASSVVAIAALVSVGVFLFVRASRNRGRADAYAAVANEVAQ